MERERVFFNIMIWKYHFHLAFTYSPRKNLSVFIFVLYRKGKTSHCPYPLPLSPFLFTHGPPL
jgi:hypothetical protein